MKCTQSVGLEPTLPEGNWFLVSRLNHSATTACTLRRSIFLRLKFRSKISMCHSSKDFHMKVVMVNKLLLWRPLPSSSAALQFKAEPPTVLVTSDKLHFAAGSLLNSNRTHQTPANNNGWKETQAIQKAGELPFWQGSPPFLLFATGFTFWQ